MSKRRRDDPPGPPTPSGPGPVGSINQSGGQTTQINFARPRPRFVVDHLIAYGNAGAGVVFDHVNADVQMGTTETSGNGHDGIVVLDGHQSIDDLPPRRPMTREERRRQAKGRR